MTHTPIKRALISVSDKTGLIDLARALSALNIEILSTGGTAKALADAGIVVVEVSKHTGFPEMLDGRVKTLHPKIHGGLLGRRNEASHIDAMKEHNIAPIDLVVITLYPFEETLAKGGNFDDCVENIDIGGPAMIRSAAKNHEHVAVITDPKDYAELLSELNANKGTSLAFRKQMAAKAFARTAAYDAAISMWFAGQNGEIYPGRFTISGVRKQQLAYGENPHQSAAFYLTDMKTPSLATATQHQGKELSYNNINDADGAWELVSEFANPTVAIIKHANPCGVASATSMKDAYLQALACDPVSAFGGIIALNRALDKETAEEIAKLFVEVIIAPAADEAAKAIIAAKPKLRLLTTGAMPDVKAPSLTFKTVMGGFLVQSKDNTLYDTSALKVVTKRGPSEQEMQDMNFALTVAKHVKSNAIVLAKDGRTIGIGAGQMSRVDSVRIAAEKAASAKLDTKGTALASEAFFPFDDNVHLAAKHGITSIIQPGGSIRDEEVIKAADEHGIAMVFTGTRHFKH